MTSRNTTRLVWATATPLEMEAVFSGLGLPLSVPAQGGYEKTLWQGRECFFLVTGVGPLLAALNFGIFLGGLRAGSQCPEAAAASLAVINAGIAGSFCLEKAPLCSLALADAELWPEYGIAGGDGADARALGFPLVAQSMDSGGAIWDRVTLSPDAALAAMGFLHPEGSVSGLSLTVAGVSGDRIRAAALRNRYAPLTENMEGFSLALACLCGRIPFVELRSISNAVGERDKAAWDIPGALQALARGVRQIACL